MSIKGERDYIYLVWKDSKTRRQYVVGQLSKNGQFEFNYGFEVKKAIENGFKLLISFDDINKVYKSDILFPVFSSRLPDAKRKGIERILLKYGLKEYNDYRLLKRSGAKLPIDNLQFIDPILDENEENIKRICYLAGSRHYVGCNGVDCAKSEDVDINEKLILQFDPENPFDKNAIKVLSSKNVHIGFIPRYYSESIINLMNNGYQYDCEIYELRRDNNCNECIKIKVEMKL